jgi:hypothetical protein
MKTEPRLFEAAKAMLGLSPTGGMSGLIEELSRINPTSEILRRLALERDLVGGAPSTSIGELTSNPGFTPRDAVLLLSREIAGQIIEGSITPLDGAELIHAISIQLSDEYPELGTFLFAALEAAERPEDRLEFEKAIMEEAHELLEK